MSTAGGPRIISDNLVLCLDAHDAKSYAGEPATNLVPNAGGVYGNSRFTTDNGWATYQTNQYNSNTYFDIGTISSVTSNVVTMSSWSRTIYSFDALRPQTTGAGVTAGTSYFIFFINGTSSSNSNDFEIYSYNADQNGDSGYIDATTGYPAVWSGVLDNGRRPNTSLGSAGSGIVTLTGTPTDMWHGAPHLPNTSIIKEVVPGGGRIKGTPCMRLHCPRGWWRSMAGDGMAYGVYPPVTLGDTIRLSFWHRPSPFGFGGEGCAGGTSSWSTYFGSGKSATSSSFYPSSTVGEWKYETHTWTSSSTFNFYIYFWPASSGTAYSMDIADLMVTVNDGGAVPWVGGTRSNSNSGDSSTGGWVDLSGNDNSGDFSNDMGPDNLFHFRDNSVMRLMTDSTNSTTGSASANPMYIDFDGTDDKVDIGSLGTNGEFSQSTISIWLKKDTQVATYGNPFDCNYLVSASNKGPRMEVNAAGTLYTLVVGADSGSYYAVSTNAQTNNVWYNVVWTITTSAGVSQTIKSYENGEYVASATSPSSSYIWDGDMADLYLGAGFTSSRHFTGQIAAFQVYKQALTVAQIKANFKAHRGRYGV